MNTFITKLTSRKFILAVAVFLVALVGINDTTVSLITASITAISYMFSEAIVDKARAVKREYKDSANVTKCYNSDGDNNNADK